ARPLSLVVRRSLRAAGAHGALQSFPTRRSSDLNFSSLDVEQKWKEIQHVRQTLEDPSYFIAEIGGKPHLSLLPADGLREIANDRSEEHTSELQSRETLVCSLLLEKKNICLRVGE